jgi:hypothetical protein
MVEESLALRGVTPDESQITAQTLHLVLTCLLLIEEAVMEEVVPGKGKHPQLLGDTLQDGPGDLTDLFEEVSPPAQDAELDCITEPQDRPATTPHFLEVFPAEQEAFLDGVRVE